MAVSLRAMVDDVRASTIPTSSSLPRGRVVLAIARIEAWQMLRHPSFLLTIAFGLLLFRGAIGIGSGGGSMLNLAWLFGGVAVGSLIGAVLTSNVAALRGRRDHLLELFGSLPSPPEARTAGVLAGIVLGLGSLSVVIGALAWLVIERTVNMAAGADLFLAVQYPLWEAGEAALLGFAKIALGWPLQVAALAVMVGLLSRNHTPLEPTVKRADAGPAPRADD